MSNLLPKMIHSRVEVGRRGKATPLPPLWLLFLTVLLLAQTVMLKNAGTSTSASQQQKDDNVAHHQKHHSKKHNNHHHHRHLVVRRQTPPNFPFPGQTPSKTVHFHQNTHPAVVIDNVIDAAFRMVRPIFNVDAALNRAAEGLAAAAAGDDFLLENNPLMGGAAKKIPPPGGGAFSDSPGVSDFGGSPGERLQRELDVLGAPKPVLLTNDDLPLCRENSQLCRFISCTAHNFKHDDSLQNLNLAAQLISDPKLRKTFGANLETIVALCKDQGLTRAQCRLFARAFLLIDRLIDTIETGPLGQAQKQLQQQQRDMARDFEDAAWSSREMSVVPVVPVATTPVSPGTGSSGGGTCGFGGGGTCPAQPGTGLGSSGIGLGSGPGNNSPGFGVPGGPGALGVSERSGTPLPQPFTFPPPPMATWTLAPLPPAPAMGSNNLAGGGFPPPPLPSPQMPTFPTLPTPPAMQTFPTMPNLMMQPANDDPLSGQLQQQQQNTVTNPPTIAASQMAAIPGLPGNPPLPNLTAVGFMDPMAIFGRAPPALVSSPAQNPGALLGVAAWPASGTVNSEVLGSQTSGIEGAQRTWSVRNRELVGGEKRPVPNKTTRNSIITGTGELRRAPVKKQNSNRAQSPPVIETGEINIAAVPRPPPFQIDSTQKRAIVADDEKDYPQQEQITRRKGTPSSIDPGSVPAKAFIEGPYPEEHHYSALARATVDKGFGSAFPPSPPGPRRHIPSTIAAGTAQQENAGGDDPVEKYRQRKMQQQQSRDQGRDHKTGSTPFSSSLWPVLKVRPHRGRQQGTARQRDDFAPDKELLIDGTTEENTRTQKDGEKIWPALPPPSSGAVLERDLGEELLLLQQQNKVEKAKKAEKEQSGIKKKAGSELIRKPAFKQPSGIGKARKPSYEENVDAKANNELLWSTTAAPSANQRTGIPEADEFLEEDLRAEAAAAILGPEAPLEEVDPETLDAWNDWITVMRVVKSNERAGRGGSGLQNPEHFRGRRDAPERDTGGAPGATGGGDYYDDIQRDELINGTPPSPGPAPGQHQLPGQQQVGGVPQQTAWGGDLLQQQQQQSLNNNQRRWYAEARKNEFTGKLDCLQFLG